MRKGSPVPHRGRGPRIGIFWGLPDADKTFRLFGFSEPACTVETVAGFKTLDLAHINGWRKIVRLQPAFRFYPYEHFPRGRVNWRAEDDLFLLLLDRQLMSDAFINRIVAKWELPPERMMVMSDQHYST